MKTKKYFLPAVMFLIGTVFGLSLIAVYSSTSPAKSPEPPPFNMKSISDAQAFYKSYLYHLKDSGVDAGFKGFTIDAAHVALLNTLLTAYPRMRVYVGYDSTATKNIILAIPVDASNKEIYSGPNPVYTVDLKATGACPPICDRGSQITKGQY